MKQQKEIDRRVEAALSSIESIGRATVQPWLYTRIKERVLQEQKSFWEKAATFLSRPGVAIAGLLLILLINSFVLVKTESMTGGKAEYADGNQVDSESMIASSSSFEYEKFVQP